MKYKYNATHTGVIQVHVGVSCVLSEFDYYHYYFWKVGLTTMNVTQS